MHAAVIISKDLVSVIKVEINGGQKNENKRETREW